MSNEVMIFIIILVIFAMLLKYFISVYNQLIMLKFNTAKAYANIDVILKQRADEVPNLIKVVKQHSAYEQETLEKLTMLRTQFLNAENQENKVSNYNAMSTLFGQVYAVSEEYPDLKASESFLDLQSRVSNLEDIIADRREFFNESINHYNIGINEFPDLFIAKLLKMNNKSLLHVSEAEKKYDGIQF